MTTKLFISVAGKCLELPSSIEKLVKESNSRLLLLKDEKVINRNKLKMKLLNRILDFKNNNSDLNINDFKIKLNDDKRFRIINQFTNSENKYSYEDYKNQIETIKILTYSDSFDKVSQQEYDFFFKTLLHLDQDKIFNFIKNNAVLFGLHEFNDKYDSILSMLLKLRCDKDSSVITLSSYYARYINKTNYF